MIIENHTYSADCCSVFQLIALFFPRNSICARGWTFPVSIIESLYSLDVLHSIKSVIVPNSVTALANNWFAHRDICTVIFEADSRLNAMDPYSFLGCSRLRSICIPRVVANIHARCFFDCLSLASVTFEQNCKLSVLGERAFSGCVSLKWVSIPSSVEVLGTDCFSFNRVSYNLLLGQRRKKVSFESNSRLREISVFAFCLF
jgi:hypothetical protein